ncbi:hypothetical protein D0S45_19670 [Marinifilum sp. JC120]|nr:hypothetical protein D0S45_19670 [Marinifilum sp. JC120]
MGKKRSFGSYFMQESKLIGCLLMVFIPVSLLLSDWEKFKCTKEILTNSWNIFEPIVGTITLAVAVVLYIANMRQSWEDDLPKVLTAEFRFRENNLLIMRADYIPLAEESDIRAWGQQLGAQMSGARGLKYFRIETSEKVSDDSTRKEYKIVFFLREVPKELWTEYYGAKFANLRDRDGVLDVEFEDRVEME